MKKFLNFDQFVNEKYTYVSEAEGEPIVPAPSAPPMAIDLGNEFQSGKWKLTPQLQQTIDAQFDKLANYIKSQGSNGATITIDSSESKVPNHDAEAQVGADGKFPVMQPGELAKKRSDTVKAAVDKFIAGLAQQGVDTSKIKVQVAPPKIGGPNWTPGQSPDDPQFKQNQFVKVLASATPNNAGSPLNQYATKGEIIYDTAKKAFGTLHYLSSTGGSTANVNTQHQPAILRLADGNTGKYTNQYVDIPAGQAQADFGTTNTVQSQQIEQDLRSQAKPVPQNDPLYGKTINDAH